jgi:hypothetical protein
VRSGGGGVLLPGDSRHRKEGGIFRAKQARAVYEALDIAKHEIVRGRSWQSYIETTVNVQRRMTDWHFAKAETWSE